MSIKSTKAIFADIIVMVISFVQFFLLLAGFFWNSDNINKFLHFNIYVIVGVLISALIIKGLIKNFLAILFYLCFLIFLLGQKIFMEEKNVFLTFVRTELDNNQYYTFLFILSIGLLAMYYSYVFFDYRNKKETSSKTLGVRDTEPILPFVRLAFWTMLPFAVYMQLKIVLVRSSVGYVEGYLVNVDISPIVKIAYYLFSGFSLIYLAMCPPKKEMNVVLILLIVIEGGVQLVQGRRAFFATTLFFVVWYLLKYYKIEKIDFKYILLGVAGIFLLIVLFFAVEMKRSNTSVGRHSLLYIIEKFMISTGGSDSVIANTIVQVKHFPKEGIWYLIDPIINNPLSIIILRKSGIPQGVNYLNNFNNFAHWISFLTESDLYKSGHGMGSCYLAEAYLAFGCIGVFMVSILLGRLLVFISRVNLEESVFKSAIVFVLVRNLFTLPRSGLFDWFGSFTYLLVTLGILYPVYKKYCIRLENGNYILEK